MSLPHSIEIKSISLFNHNKKILDLSQVVAEIDIYHSLFDSCNLCELLIADSVGILEFFPITGDETIAIAFKTPTFEKTKEYVFRVYKIGRKRKEKQKNDVYILYGCSQELINNARFSVNKSFKGQSATQMVKGIYNSFLKPKETDHYFVKEKTLTLQETEGNHHLVFTDKTPLDSIYQICREGRAKNESGSKSSNFIFYENSKGWEFRTIDSLLEQQEVDTFFLSPGSLTIRQKEGVKEYQKITKIVQHKQFDTMEGLINGLYYNTIETIDPILKKFTQDSFIYEKHSNKIKHLDSEKGNLYPIKSIFGAQTESTAKHYITSFVGQNYATTGYLDKKITAISDPQLYYRSRKHESLKFDIASTLQINNIIIDIEVPGNSDIDIGEVINIIIPQNTNTKSYEGYANLLLSKKYSEKLTARFLITHIRHKINTLTNSYTTIMSCAKDSYSEQVNELSGDLSPAQTAAQALS